MLASASHDPQVELPGAKPNVLYVSGVWANAADTPSVFPGMIVFSSVARHCTVFANCQVLCVLPSVTPCGWKRPTWTLVHQSDSCVGKRANWASARWIATRDTDIASNSATGFVMMLSTLAFGRSR